jgi:hypothetical protein
MVHGMIAAVAIDTGVAVLTQDRYLAALATVVDLALDEYPS